MHSLKSTWLAIAVLCSIAVAAPASAQQTVPFKVFITELWQLDDTMDPLIGAIGDFYAKITINGVVQDNKGACRDGTATGILVPFPVFKNFSKISECSAKTPWVFTQQVQVGQPVHVKIQIFDEDLVLDDEADLKVGDGNAIDLDVDPNSGLWSGDISWPQNCSRPNLNLGGNNANVCWQIGYDSDDDGLLDVWEKFGVDTNNDGIIDIDLPALGANPFRKDIFVEADYLLAATHTHAPQKDAVESIVRSFANAPIRNGDGTTGVQLHIDVGELLGTGVTQIAGNGGAIGTYGNLGGGGNVIPEAGNEIIAAFSSGKGPGTKFDDLAKDRFDPLRETIFRYVIFGHQTNARVASNDCTSGVANRTRRQFLVTLGGVGDDGKPCWGTDAGGHSVGFNFQQAGTLMHELGHTLGLQHGGDDKINDKPNYLSVMNYTFQACDVPFVPGKLPGGCDYQRLFQDRVPDLLKEEDLDECVGIGGGLGLGKVDWNGDRTFEGASRCGLIFENTHADTNNDGVCVAPGPNGRLETKEAGDDKRKEDKINDGANRFCATSPTPGTDDVQVTAVGFTPDQPPVLHSFDDWDSINPSMIDFAGDTTNTGADEEQEPDARTIADSRRFLGDMMAPAVTLDLTGPSTAKAGDVLAYRLEVTNPGRGPALSAVLLETDPGGGVTTTDVGVITAGEETTRTSSFTVPATACPGDFTGASASMSFKDFVGQNLAAAATAPLQINDVAAPAVEVVLSPAVLWPPNHKFVEISATINQTDNCDAHPTVTLVSIVSSEPGNNKEPDIDGAAFGTDDRTFSLRAERANGRNDRVYTVTYRVTDASGNSTVKTATVTVPANQGNK